MIRSFTGNTMFFEEDRVSTVDTAFYSVITLVMREIKCFMGYILFYFDTVIWYCVIQRFAGDRMFYLACGDKVHFDITLYIYKSIYIYMIMYI